jgi:hypothetical protein
MEAAGGRVRIEYRWTGLPVAATRNERTTDPADFLRKLCARREIAGAHPFEEALVRYA